MRKNKNQIHIEGRIYDHDLSLKEVKNKDSDNYGKTFIQGKIYVATDEEAINVVEINYTYVTEFTKAGKKNNTFSVLKQVIDNEETWLSVGKDSALKISADTALNVNDFYDMQNEEMISFKRCEGGFIKIIQYINDKEEDRNNFIIDLLIYGSSIKEKDDGSLDKMIVNAYAFDFRNRILPVVMTIKNENGINFISSYDVREPLYVCCKGKIEYLTKREQKVTEGVWGEPIVDNVETKIRDWVITGMSTIYDYGDETILTEEEVKKALQDRELLLADIKQKRIDYENERSTISSMSNNAMNSPVQKGTFNF